MAKIQVVYLNLLEADPVRSEIFLHSYVCSINPFEQGVVAHDLVVLNFKWIHPRVVVIELQLGLSFLAILDVKQESVHLSVIIFLGYVVVEPIVMVERDNHIQHRSMEFFDRDPEDAVVYEFVVFPI